MASAHRPLEPLVPGEGMDSQEFLARWRAMPNLKNAELLDGIVYMPSAVSRFHGGADSRIQRWVGRYVDATPGCQYVPNTTWVLEDRSVPQPDLALYILPEYGGQCSYSDDLLAGAPELAVEVAYSSADRDFRVKKAVYQRSGVQEYITVDLLTRILTWRVLESGLYVDLNPDNDGILRSRVFSGLWLDPFAFWNEDGARIAEVVNRGLATPEHAQFVAQLQSKRR